MAGKPKKILFISHEASLSGATFVLIELIKWMKLHGQIEASVLLKEDGPVRARFEEISSVYNYHFNPRQFSNRLLSAIYRRLIWPRQKERYRARLLQRLRNSGFDLIYANTIAVGDVLGFLTPLKCKVVTHVHELQYVIDCMGPENINQVIKASSFFVAVCQDIKNILIQKYMIDADKILLVPEFVNFDRIDSDKMALNARGQLKIPEECFIVGGAGSVEWRKGVDLFLEVAIRVLAQIPSARFIWVGNPRETNIMTKLNYDIKKAGLEKTIQFVGPFHNPYPYYDMFDIFLLPSREDPYPLVCIENMYLNKPVICFKQSGGAVSLITDYRLGKAVQYLDTNLMAEAVINYFKNRQDEFPAIDLQRFRVMHSAETVASRIFQIISNL